MANSLRHQLEEQQSEILALKKELELFHQQAKIDRATLKQNEVKFQSLVENIPGSTFRCLLDEDWTMLYISNEIEVLSGYPASDYIGSPPLRTFADIMHPDDIVSTWENTNRAVAEKKPFTNEYRVIDKQGVTHYVYAKGQAIYAEGGEPEYLDGSIFDISKLRMTELQLRKKEEHLTKAERIAHLGSWEWDITNNLVYWSEETYKIFGVQAPGFTPSYEAYIQFSHPDDRDMIQKNVDDALAGHIFDIEHRIIRENGINRFVHIIGDLETDEQGIPVKMIGIVHDISENKKNELALKSLNVKLEKLSLQDGLTDIANRRMFDTTMDHEWNRCIREQQAMSLIMIDIDFFKQYNDIYGHQSGDDCLKMIAQKMAQLAKRSIDLCARYGGEEFVLLLPNTNLVQATKIAEKCRENIYQLSIPHEGSSINDVVTVSVGVSSISPVVESLPSSLIRHADKALYLAKDTGRNVVKSLC